MVDLRAFNREVWDMRRDAANREGIPPEIKVLAVLRYLGTGRALDDLDDSCRMSAETVRQYVVHFCRDIIDMFGEQYLNRRPNASELDGIQRAYAASGFPGCVGSVDCCSIKWKNCPIQVKGQYHNPKDSKLAVIKVEAWCDSKLYIWHWFAGRAGTNNDKTMVAFSPLFQDILSGKYPFMLPTPYRILPGGVERRLAYLLGDGIYPRWPIFALPIHASDNIHEETYTKRQEGRRKDIERAFGVLQARFGILRQDDHRWYKGDIVDSSKACVIIHNLLDTNE